MDLWAVLIPILIGDVVNPMLLAALIHALGSQRPLLVSSALLAGHTLMYLGAGILIGLGLDALVGRLENPLPIDFVIEAVIGAALLAAFVAMLSGKKPEERYDESDVAGFGVGSAFGAGVLINLVGIPFALPYFGAVSQVVKADLTAGGVVAVLLAYNALYALPFVGVIAARAAFGARADPALAKLNSVMERVSGVLIPLLLLVLGLALLADAISFWVRGQPLLAV